MGNPFRFFFRGRRRRRDFASASQRSENPLFSEKERHRGRWISLAVFALGTLVFAYSIASPRFRITTVKVEGTVKLDPASVTEYLNAQLNETFLGVAWRRVTFLAPLTTLTRDLRIAIEKRMSLNNLAIRRGGERTLVVRIQERSPNLVWETAAGERSFIDDHGVIIEELGRGEATPFAILKDSNGLPAIPGDVVVQPHYIESLRSVGAKLADAGIQVKQYETWKVYCTVIQQPREETPPEEKSNILNVNSLNLNKGNANVSQNVNIGNVNSPAEVCDEERLARTDPTLVAVTLEGWRVRFDTSADLEHQMAKLTVALRERIGDSTKKLRYIDVRFGDRVFYQ